MGNAKRYKFALLVCVAVVCERSAYADTRPWLGVDICNITTQHPLQPATTAGAYVQLVRKGSPASSAGVEPADILISIDDSLVSSAENLVCAVARRVPGSLVRLALIRDGTLRVTVATLIRSPKRYLANPVRVSSACRLRCDAVCLAHWWRQVAGLQHNEEQHAEPHLVESRGLDQRDSDGTTIRTMTRRSSMKPALLDMPFTDIQ